MILFYALGGGFGHLTRVKTFINNYNISEPFTVCTNNPLVYRLFHKEQITFLSDSVPFTTSELAAELKKVIDKMKPDQVYIDTFPLGILGELTFLSQLDIAINLLCRRLKWNTYSKTIETSLPFSNAYVFEALEASHLAYLNKNGKNIIPAKLTYETATQQPELIKSLVNPIWLIVHSSDADELQVIFDHAVDISKLQKVTPTFVIISDQQFITDLPVHFTPKEEPVDWYPYADKIFTAAGFNTWHQLVAWRAKHTVLPFPRKFDDQFWRAKSKP